MEKADNSSYIHNKKRLELIAFIIGILCFSIVFIPFTRITMTGHAWGDMISISLMFIGVTLTSILLKKYGRSPLLIFSLILTLSFPIYLVILFVALFTGLIEFGP
ncbi:hypothetical protein BTR22_10590 [Alkalihalophilus pseudofirmus]|jgi:hypothetical protein|uniref:hypothetical protein n=1 Tax=Alkalihalophilus TaxID=2893060 RepID=UPI0009511722|nr:hypothetical protein [Alkalihalophilus marmarensis]MED1603382.1 hypothetical protein [Alkalihalophilus marmarensis]OLS37121.1 hypothetical protein BTR22_10590 [Alkalihalophilus pseudofirmus]